jgi:hypothetical protein
VHEQSSKAEVVVCVHVGHPDDANCEQRVVDGRGRQVEARHRRCRSMAWRAEAAAELTVCALSGVEYKSPLRTQERRSVPDVAQKEGRQRTSQIQP